MCMFCLIVWGRFFVFDGEDAQPVGTNAGPTTPLLQDYAFVLAQINERATQINRTYIKYSNLVLLCSGSLVASLSTVTVETLRTAHVKTNVFLYKINLRTVKTRLHIFTLL